MHEATNRTIKGNLPPTTVKTIDLRKVYALLYRAYLRSQSPENDDLSHEKEIPHE